VQDPMLCKEENIGDKQHWSEVFLNFVYPPVCQLCGEEAADYDKGYIGPICFSRVKRIKPPFCERCGLPYYGDITGTFECSNCKGVRFYFKNARSALIADEFVLGIIHAYKYNAQVWLEKFLASELIKAALGAIQKGGYNFIVPVPLHPLKKRERGFNQAACIAKHLGTASGLPVREDLVMRVVHTRTQTTLSKKERLKNVTGAFGPISDTDITGSKVIIVDDVFTTGATTNACARVLKDMGADEITVWTVARGL